MQSIYSNIYNQKQQNPSTFQQKKGKPKFYVKLHNKHVNLQYQILKASFKNIFMRLKF